MELKVLNDSDLSKEEAMEKADFGLYMAVTPPIWVGLSDRAKELLGEEPVLILSEPGPIMAMLTQAQGNEDEFYFLAVHDLPKIDNLKVRYMSEEALH